MLEVQRALERTKKSSSDDLFSVCFGNPMKVRLFWWVRIYALSHGPCSKAEGFQVVTERKP